MEGEGRGRPTNKIKRENSISTSSFTYFVFPILSPALAKGQKIKTNWKLGPSRLSSAPILWCFFLSLSQHQRRRRKTKTKSQLRLFFSFLSFSSTPTRLLRPKINTCFPTYAARKNKRKEKEQKCHLTGLARGWNETPTTWGKCKTCCPPKPCFGDTSKP